MTRTEFVRAYALRSDLSDKWARLGMIDIDGHTMIALPCACGKDGCKGWAMVSASGVLHHLQFCAPEQLRGAYMNAIHQSGEADD